MGIILVTILVFLVVLFAFKMGERYGWHEGVRRTTQLKDDVIRDQAKTIAQQRIIIGHLRNKKGGDKR